MIVITPQLLLALAPVIGACAALVWAFRRHPKSGSKR
jgi:hypothetical protein